MDVLGRLVGKQYGRLAGISMNSYKDQLARIEEAIAAIEGGAQSYSIGSRRVERASLSTLYEERRKLRARASDEESGEYSGVMYGEFDRR